MLERVTSDRRVELRYRSEARRRRCELDEADQALEIQELVGPLRFAELLKGDRE